MFGKIQEDLNQEIETIREEGLYKSERIIHGPQRARIEVKDGDKVLNMCANNYLGLADHSEVMDYV